MDFPSLYDDPALYDVLHDAGTEDEAWLLDRLARERKLPLAALEPACGTGRYLEALAKRGWTVAGYDSSPKMVAYARRRLHRFGVKASVDFGDMRRHRAEPVHGLAFSLLSTFRHLDNDRDALSHLKSVASSLILRGVFILGLDLADYAHDLPDEEVWLERRGGREWRQLQSTLPADSRRRRETILNVVSEPDGRMREFRHELRSYDAAEISSLIARSPFQLESCLGPDGRVKPLDGPERSLWLILSRR